VTPAWRLQILDSIHQIEASRWDVLNGRRAINRSHAYLCAIEAAALEGCRYFYPVIYDEDGEILAHACVSLVRTDFSQLLPARWQGMIARLRHLWPGFLRAHLTELGSPLIAGHSFSIRAGAPRAALLQRLADAASAIAARERSRIVLVRDLLKEDGADIAALRAQGFNLVSNMPLARIRVRWRSYADYLADMRPRYRKDTLRRLRLARAAGLEVRVIEPYGGEAERWLAQMRVVYAAAERFKRETLTSGYYRAIERYLGADSRLFAVVCDGIPIAHGMVLVDDENTFATFFGREAGPPGKEWFLLINEVIRLGIERGSRAIHLGLGSYHGKALVGAEIEALTICCRSTWAPVNWLMRLVPDVVSRGADRERNIFR
jgi:predicted N-acyltransferase